MNTRAAIETMMKGSRYNGSQLSSAMGKHRNFLSTTFTKGSIPRVDTLAHMAQVMGYELVLKGHGEEIVIDPPEDEK
ncbi:MAG: hypothetical protein RR672_01150 [Raoultibacter sp.]